VILNEEFIHIFGKYENETGEFDMPEDIDPENRLLYS